MDPTKPQAWWHVPHMWLVVGGPLVVVIASFITLYLALRGADTLVDRSAPVAPVQAASPAMVPAMDGRNHAATGAVTKP